MNHEEDKTKRSGSVTKCKDGPRRNYWTSNNYLLETICLMENLTILHVG